MNADTGASGKRLWIARYNGPGNADDSAYSVAVSPGGGTVFVTGSSFGSTGYNYLTVAYDAASGARLWARRYEGPLSLDEAFALAPSPDGSKLFVTGLSYNADGTDDYETLAYSATTGARLWASRYDGPGGFYDAAAALKVSPDGSKVFVTGWSYGNDSESDYATVAYDAATGARLWVSRYDGPSHNLDYAYGLDLSPDGSRVFVTGQSYAEGTEADYATVAYDAATGAELWSKRYDGPAGGDDAGYELAVSPDGSRVFVSGASSDSSGARDYATVAYDASNGARLWARRYDGPAKGDDVAIALGLSPDGSRVFAAGQSAGSTGSDDYATVAYDAATGDRLWVRRYDGPGHALDKAYALAASADGQKVFVTGQSTGSEGDADYATVAYAAG